MKTIWKYKLIGDLVALQMPRNAEILTAAAQHTDICVWALVDTDMPMAERRFAVVGTGHPAPDFASKADHVGIVEFVRGDYIFHVFDLGETR